MSLSAKSALMRRRSSSQKEVSVALRFNAPIVEYDTVVESVERCRRGLRPAFHDMSAPPTIRNCISGL